MNKYDIYVANLLFTQSDGTIYEERSPVVILDPSRNIVLSVKCTHHWVRWCNDLDYEVQEWREAGLSQPTVVMFNYPLLLETSQIDYQVGRLTDYDILWVDNVANEIIRNYT